MTLDMSQAKSIWPWLTRLRQRSNRSGPRSGCSAVGVPELITGFLAAVHLLLSLSLEVESFKLTSEKGQEKRA